MTDRSDHHLEDELDDDWERIDAAGDEVTVRCPYCGEAVELLLDPMVEGELVQDCEVCCRPWSVVIDRSGGRPRVDVDVL